MYTRKDVTKYKLEFMKYISTLNIKVEQCSGVNFHQLLDRFFSSVLLLHLGVRYITHIHHSKLIFIMNKIFIDYVKRKCVGKKSLINTFNSCFSTKQ